MIKEQEARLQTFEVCRKHGLSTATFDGGRITSDGGVSFLAQTELAVNHHELPPRPRR